MYCINDLRFSHEAPHIVAGVQTSNVLCVLNVEDFGQVHRIRSSSVGQASSGSTAGVVCLAGRSRVIADADVRQRHTHQAHTQMTGDEIALCTMGFLCYRTTNIDTRFSWTIADNKTTMTMMLQVSQRY